MLLRYQATDSGTWLKWRDEAIDLPRLVMGRVNERCLCLSVCYNQSGAGAELGKLPDAAQRVESGLQVYPSGTGALPQLFPAHLSILEYK